MEAREETARRPRVTLSGRRAVLQYTRIEKQGLQRGTQEALQPQLSRGIKEYICRCKESDNSRESTHGRGKQETRAAVWTCFAVAAGTRSRFPRDLTHIRVRAFRWLAFKVDR